MLPSFSQVYFLFLCYNVVFIDQLRCCNSLMCIVFIPLDMLCFLLPSYIIFIRQSTACVYMRVCVNLEMCLNIMYLYLKTNSCQLLFIRDKILLAIYHDHTVFIDVLILCLRAFLGAGPTFITSLIGIGILTALVEQVRLMALICEYLLPQLLPSSFSLITTP